MSRWRQRKSLCRSRHISIRRPFGRESSCIRVTSYCTVVGESMHQLTCGASGWASVSMAPEFLFQQHKLLAGLDLVLPSLGRILRPPGSAVTQLRRLHEKACRLAESKAERILHREITRALEQDLLHTLINCLATEDAHGHAAVRRHHSNIMVRFEEWLMTHLESHFHIRELCAAIDVPERTLRACCAEFLGMSPNRYLRLRRLNKVHAALLRADPATTSVSTLATRQGFSQLGRFAVLYRTVFGETPSTTLRRSQPNAYLGASAEIA